MTMDLFVKYLLAGVTGDYASFYSLIFPYLLSHTSPRKTREERTSPEERKSPNIVISIF